MGVQGQIFGTATRASDYAASGPAYDANRNQIGTASSSITTDPTDGTETVSLDAPTYGLTSKTITLLSPEYYDYSTSAVSIGSGLVMNTNAANNTADVTVPGNGITYYIHGKVDADNLHVDETISDSFGNSAMLVLDPSSMLSPPDSAAPQSIKRIMDNGAVVCWQTCMPTRMPTFGDVAGATGAVGVIATFVGIWAPGPVGRICSTVAVVAGIATASLLQADDQEKKKKKTQAKN